MDKLWAVISPSYPQLSPSPSPHISLSQTHLLPYTQAQAFASSLGPLFSSVPSFPLLIQTDPAYFHLYESPNSHLTYGTLTPAIGLESLQTIIRISDSVAYRFNLETYFPAHTPHISLGVGSLPGPSEIRDTHPWPVKSFQVHVHQIDLLIGKERHSFPLQSSSKSISSH